jgi:hypothetical protein
MRLWPFRKKRTDEESYFSSTGGAKVAPEAPPVIGGPAGSASSPLPSATPSSAPPPAAPTVPATAGGISSMLPPEVVQQLAAAGIHLDPKANVQVSTQTSELSGAQALQFLGQLGSFFGGAALQSGTIQMHPQIQILSDGRLQESAEQLKTKGVDAQATVKDLQDKMAMGDTHVVKLKLEVTRAGSEPYEVTTGAIVPARITEQFAEGKTFPAKVDPNDQNQVLILWPGA